MYLCLTHHLTATADAKSSLKAATEESEQAEATIEAINLQAKKDTDDMAMLRKRVTELEAQNKLEHMKYQGVTLSPIHLNLLADSLSCKLFLSPHPLISKPRAAGRHDCC